MTEIFGDFVETGNIFEYLVISFDPSKMSMEQRWKGNSISANFLAAYWGTFCPSYSPELAHTQMKDTISWTANEMIENAVKFSDVNNFYPIKIFLNLSESTLDFYVENSISSENSNRLKARIREMETTDIADMYFKQIQDNAETNADESRLGFLIMKMDLGAKLGWKFETRKSPTDMSHDVETVTTMVRLPIEKG
ncbi:MAG: ATP-binding protein [Deltaproteobacteria bacterium]|nr:ATP-binding protein [Deltaproteobacteria bacterium]